METATATTAGAPTVTLGQALRRAHDAYATSHEARRVVFEYRSIKAAEGDCNPYCEVEAFRDGIRSPEGLAAIRRADHEVAQACRAQLAAVTALVGAARRAGLGATMTNRGPGLGDGVEARITDGPRRASISTGMGTIHIDAENACITHNGIPVGAEIRLYELPAWFGLDPDAPVPGAAPEREEGR